MGEPHGALKGGEQFRQLRVNPSLVGKVPDKTVDVPPLRLPADLVPAARSEAAAASRYDISCDPAALSGASVPQKNVRKAGAFRSLARNDEPMAAISGNCSARSAGQSGSYLTTPGSLL